MAKQELDIKIRASRIMTNRGSDYISLRIGGQDLWYHLRRNGYNVRTVWTVGMWKNNKWRNHLATTKFLAAVAAAITAIIVTSCGASAPAYAQATYRATLNSQN